MASLDSLTDGEIRTKLIELGCPVGPVTATTRKVLLKKLKLLLDQSSSPGKGNLDYDPRCSVTQFSSGEESDDGSNKLRRRSMPPPKTTKSPRKKSPSRGAPLANSTVVDHPSKTVLSEDVTSTTFESRRSARQSVTPHELPSYLSRLQTDFDLGDRNDILSRPSIGLMRNNEGNSTLTSPSRFSTSDIGGGLADGYRSRTSPQTSSSFTPQLSSVSYKSNQPYSSEFARRLTSLTSSRVSSVSPSSVSQKFLDVKESDDEDNGSVPVYTKFSHSNLKGNPNLQTRANGKGVFSQENWFSYDSPVSAVLLVILLLFFAMIGFTYVNMHSVETNLVVNTDLKYPLCSLVRIGAIPGENCIRDDDIQVITSIFKLVQKELFERTINGGCLAELEPLSDQDIVNLVVDKEKTMSVWVIENQMNNLKLLISHNPDWKIVSNHRGTYLLEPPVTLFCQLYRRCTVAANWLFKLLLLTGGVWACYRGTRWWMWRTARYNDEVYRLVSNILEVVSAKAQDSPAGYVPISHVRDQLIAHKDRSKMAKLWNDAVKILESDSRLRCEVQQVEGEEFDVWRWLASPLNSKRKVWQGQAFETVEGSVNSLPDSPTPCLKIRHMFDPSLEEGEDWDVTVADAILEKCGDAKILHIAVDKQSREGCVYMKCVSQRDAGIAYRALHGSWFDSKLVTVKYIREKRYLERFPDSIRSNEPLRPSNDMKNSLQN